MNAIEEFAADLKARFPGLHVEVKPPPYGLTSWYLQVNYGAHLPACVLWHPDAAPEVAFRHPATPMPEGRDAAFARACARIEAAGPAPRGEPSPHGAAREAAARYEKRAPSGDLHDLYALLDLADKLCRAHPSLRVGLVYSAHHIDGPAGSSTCRLDVASQSYSPIRVTRDATRAPGEEFVVSDASGPGPGTAMDFASAFLVISARLRGFDSPAAAVAAARPVTPPDTVVATGTWRDRPPLF